MLQLFALLSMIYEAKQTNTASVPAEFLIQIAQNVDVGYRPVLVLNNSNEAPCPFRVRFRPLSIHALNNKSFAPAVCVREKSAEQELPAWVFVEFQKRPTLSPNAFL